MTRDTMCKLLNVIMVILYVLSVFSVGMYEADMITFKQCMHDIIINSLFGFINWIIKGQIRRI